MSLFKICTKCNIKKSIEDFYQCKGRYKYGRTPTCKICTSKISSDKMKTPKGRLYLRNKNAEFRKNHAEKFKMGVKMSRYKKLGLKITESEYRKLYELQNGYCAICKTHVSSCKQELSLDHNHDTGKIRGFLCMNCNLALGKFKDNSDILFAAIDYIFKHR